MAPSSTPSAGAFAIRAGTSSCRHHHVRPVSAAGMEALQGPAATEAEAMVTTPGIMTMTTHAEADRIWGGAAILDLPRKKKTEPRSNPLICSAAVARNGRTPPIHPQRVA